LSAIKGGRLSSFSKARVATLAISDVPGDDPSLIASGPTVPDHTRPGDALDVLAKYAIDPGIGIRNQLRESKAMSVCLRDWDADTFTTVASGETMLKAAQHELENAGFRVVNLGDQVEGEALELARQHARLAKKLWRTEGRHCILSGGETTVTIRGAAGFGGRNTEYLLALAIALDGIKHTWALAADSDGIDGRGNQAGAMIGPDTLSRAASVGLKASHFLQTHDSGSFFRRLGNLVVTGPTLTNVNDFRAILIDR
jgi:hydroxypyruvate reductase